MAFKKAGRRIVPIVPTSKQSHIHKYGLDYQDHAKTIPIYKCFDNCTHYLPKISLTAGMQSICWGCGKIFSMTEQIVYNKIKRPKCPECVESWRSPSYRKHHVGDAALEKLAALVAKELKEAKEKDELDDEMKANLL